MKQHEEEVQLTFIEIEQQFKKHTLDQAVMVLSRLDILARAAACLDDSTPANDHIQTARDQMLRAIQSLKRAA